MHSPAVFSNISSQNLQSQVIDFLRFPLIVCVVFIHNIASTVEIRGVEFGSNIYMPLFYYCTEFFRGPLAFRNQFFFFVSGFLFFGNIEKFGLLSYKNKLQNRTLTLLVPYLFWNLAAFFFFYFMITFGFFSSPMSCNILKQFWCENIEKDGITTYPIAVQFWYIRDLLVAVILTPIIYFFVKKMKIYGIVTLGILWYLNWWFEYIGGRGFSITCIFFFTAGAYFGINKRNLLNDFSEVKHLSFLLYPLLSLANLFTREEAFNPYIHNMNTIFGIIFIFNLTAILLKKGKIKVNRFLTTSSFFIYAVHVPFLSDNFKKLSFLLFKPEADLPITALFFINVILTVLTALGLYYILMRFCPKFTNVILGGRYNKERMKQKSFLIT